MNFVLQTGSNLFFVDTLNFFDDFVKKGWFLCLFFLKKKMAYINKKY